jgi:hypothetical protein
MSGIGRREIKKSPERERTRVSGFAREPEKRRIAASGTRRKPSAAPVSGLAAVLGRSLHSLSVVLASSEFPELVSVFQFVRIPIPSGLK